MEAYLREVWLELDAVDRHHVTISRRQIEFNVDLEKQAHSRPANDPLIERLVRFLVGEPVFTP